MEDADDEDYAGYAQRMKKAALEIVDAVNEVGATPASLIAILDALNTSGSLRAELVVL